MIKNIAAAAVLAFGTALVTGAPAQAATPQSAGAFPWPPYGHVLLAPAPLRPAVVPLRPAVVPVRPADRGWFAYAPLVVDDTRG
ncbi:hypothetical protein ACFXB3_11650 [Streptomyces sp. NPDC059447]|uniref:hypothetical protein n=1 Tax=Streptomyces sp. NPDC059447 TaxID=3346834 RepID=UPI0036B1BCB4